MLSKKRILWTLVALALIGTTLVLRHEHQQRKEAAAAKAKRDKARKAKAKVVVEEEPDEKPAPPKKVPKATVLSPATKTYLAEQAFIAALRGVFQWRSQQPATPETSRALLAKLSTVAFEDLSPEHKTAWQSLLQSWRQMNDPSMASDPQLKAQSQQATDALNALFKAHGDGDIVL
jgi:hypothetical protein